MCDPLTLDEVRLDGRLDELARLFWKEEPACELLEFFGFPRKDTPSFDSPGRFWRAVCELIDRGSLPPERTLPALFEATLRFCPGSVRLFPGPAVPRWKLTKRLLDGLTGRPGLLDLLRGRRALAEGTDPWPEGPVFARLRLEYRLIDGLTRRLAGLGQCIDPRADAFCRELVRDGWVRPAENWGERTLIGYAWELVEDPGGGRLFAYVRMLRETFGDVAAGLASWEADARTVLAADPRPAGGPAPAGPAWLSVIVVPETVAGLFKVKGWLTAPGGPTFHPLGDDDPEPVAEPALAGRVAALRREAMECVEDSEPGEPIHVEVFLPDGLLGREADQWPSPRGRSGDMLPIGSRHPFVLRSLHVWGDPDARRAIKARWGHLIAQDGPPPVVTSLPTQAPAAYLHQGATISIDGLSDLEDSGGVVCVLLGDASLSEEAAAACLRRVLDVGIPAVLWLRQAPETGTRSGTLTALLNGSAPRELHRSVWNERRGYRTSSPDVHPCRNITLLLEDPGRVPPDLGGGRRFRTIGGAAR